MNPYAINAFAPSLAVPCPMCGAWQGTQCHPVVKGVPDRERRKNRCCRARRQAADARRTAQVMGRQR
jgi:hypothetical protein